MENLEQDNLLYKFTELLTPNNL